MDIGTVVCCCFTAVLLAFLFAAYKLGLFYQLFHKVSNLKSIRNQ